jgi:hypothetical protein
MDFSFLFFSFFIVVASTVYFHLKVNYNSSQYDAFLMTCINGLIYVIFNAFNSLSHISRRGPGWLNELVS